MTIGQVFFIISAVLFFLVGIGASAIPNGMTWGWFCLALGLLTSGYPLWRGP